MIKCFLSHSSQDKESYVRKVATKLRREIRIFDEETFEAGMSPSEEILNGLDTTSLFVIFISDAALSSEWVQQELKIAKDKVAEGLIDRIYPIIIDDKITFTDSRIPLWMKNGFNIQHIKQPKVAARKINARLRELSWKTHPTLKEREKIFVGRNDQISKVEQRFDDFSKVIPTVFIASGLTSIGRKSFMKNALIKANAIRESYEFPLISFEPHDSIEDFILKTDDLGLTSEINIKDLLITSIEDKIKIATKLILEIIQEQERIMIEDRGAIIQHDGEIVDWFNSIIDNIKDKDFLTFCIASKFRANRRVAINKPQYYMEEIPELDKTERSGLLYRYSNYKKIDMERTDLLFFSNLLTGYPEQVIFTVDTISESSVFEAKRNSHFIQEYATDKAKTIIDNLSSDTHQLNFLYFLSRFEFISFEFLFDLVSEEEYYPILNSFLQHCICERLGSTGDYIRVNEIVRDFIARSMFGLADEFSELLKQHVVDFMKNYSDEKSDISDYIFSIQEALKSGIEIDSRLLVPSYFVKTIKSLYERGGSSNYREAIKLSDRVLLNEDYLHEKIINHIRFIKCQALARLRDGDFFAEVKMVSEPESSFLHGFFFRISGNQERAIASYTRVLNKKPNDYRAKSELILVYMQSDEHDLAYDLARDLYNRIPNNPINANNYLSCLFHKDKNTVDINIVNDILEKLKANLSDRSQEMYCSAKAKTLAKFENKVDEAFQIIDEGIKKYPKVKYPVLTLCDLAFQYRRIDKFEEAIRILDATESKNSQTYLSYIRNKAIYLTLIGKHSDGISLARQELVGIRHESMVKFYELLKQLAIKW
jgi:tetratricopeptide (TPR) repeat protein